MANVIWDATYPAAIALNESEAESSRFFVFMRRVEDVEDNINTDTVISNDSLNHARYQQR